MRLDCMLRRLAYVIQELTDICLPHYSMEGKLLRHDVLGNMASTERFLIQLPSFLT